MHRLSFFRATTLISLAALSLGLLACNAASQGLSSRGFDNLPAPKSVNPEARPGIGSVPTFHLALSVADAYAAIPHRRTAADFAASNMPDEDRRFLEAAFQLIDQSIRLRVTAYRKFSQGESSDTQLLADMDRAIEFLENLTTPANLNGYRKQLLKALSDQRAFFREWSSQGRQFQYAAGQRIGSHPGVRNASNALRQAYEILMRQYPDEGQHNKDAFFDYHCALDFL
jgi:hypothetical protein